MNGQTVREAVAVFPDPEKLQDAVDELLVHGFDRSDVSVMATSATVEQALGHVYRRIEEVEDDPKAPHIAYVGHDSQTEAKGAAAAALAYIGAVAAAGAIVASGGALAVTIAAAAIAGGAGGAIGAAFAGLIGASQARQLADQLERGGILLWVRTPDAQAEKKACDILGRRGGTNVHVHELPAPVFPSAGGVSEDLAWINKPIADWFGAHRARQETAGAASRPGAAKE